MRTERDTAPTARTRLLDRRLRLSLGLFFLIAVIMLGLLISHVARGDGSLGWALLSLALGGIIGWIMIRVTLLHWDDAQHAVVSQMDALGVAVLGLYLLFLFMCDQLIGRSTDDAPLVSKIGLGLTAGTMIGRVVFTLRGIRGVLTTAGIAPRFARQRRR